jgi:hypothetical protein
MRFSGRTQVARFVLQRVAVTSKGGAERTVPAEWLMAQIIGGRLSSQTGTAICCEFIHIFE